MKRLPHRTDTLRRPLPDRVIDVVTPERVFGGGLILIAALMLVVVIGMVVGPTSGGDPRTGWAPVTGVDGLSKACDGGTLVYSNGGTVPNSPDCAH